jgi:hypothetical protein
MKLKKYLRKNNIKQVEFARQNRFSKQQVHGWTKTGYFVRNHKGKKQLCKVMQELES